MRPEENCSHALRRARLASYVLHDWDGALAHERDRHRMGARAVARDVAGGVGGAGPDDPAVSAAAGGSSDRLIVLDQPAQLPGAVLGFAGCATPSYDPALWALRTWLDSCPGIGHVTLKAARITAF